MAAMAAEDQSPYVELDRAAWAALAESMSIPLNAEEVERLRGLGDELDLDEVAAVYLPISRLLSLYVRHVGALHRDTTAFLGDAQQARTPFVIGIAGSVAVGKSTTARLLARAARALARASQRRACHDRRIPLPQCRAREPRSAAAQGFSGVVRPAGAAQVRDRHQVRQGTGVSAGVLPPQVRRDA